MLGNILLVLLTFLYGDKQFSKVVEPIYAPTSNIHQGIVRLLFGQSVEYVIISQCNVKWHLYDY